MEILLTNDDSHISPLFEMAVEKLGMLGNLKIVVPKEEQSWTGKSISRFKHLYVDEIIIYGHPAYCIDGTPADCINWGIYHGYEKKPDLVVSGINIGSNTGIGFALSSGTIGACFEANIADIPGVALSQDLNRETFIHWLENNVLPEGVIDHLKQQTDTLLDKVFQSLLDNEKILEQSATWNVNLPFQGLSACRLVRTFLGHTFYTSCFKRIGDRFHHQLEPFHEDRRQYADGAVVREGHVSITKIDIRDLGYLPGAE